MITVDGTSYSNLAISVTRTAEIRESDNSGMMLDGSYFSDAIGTYLTYSVKIAVPVDRESLYTVLYEAITDPVGYHTFNLPYNQGTVNITGRVSHIEDSFYRQEGTRRVWRQISFDIQSNYPSKQYTLGQIIDIGMQTVPDVVAPTEGDVYRYTNGSWVQTSYRDVDEVYF